MKDGNLKAWHLILAVALQLLAGGLWAGSIGSEVRGHEKRITASEADVKRMDNEGPAVWRNSLRFSDKEAEQIRRDMEAMRKDLQAQGALLIRIEQQLKP